jgi:hypothetical protein
MKKPLLALSLILSLPVLGVAQDSAKRISLQLRGVPVRAVIAELQQQAGVPLAVAGTVGDHIVVVQVKDAPLDQLLERLARVTSGKWEDVGSGRQLVSDDDLRRRQQAEELQRRTNLIREEIKAQSAAVLGRSFTDQDAQRMAREADELNRQLSNSTGNIPDTVWERQSQLQNSAPLGRLLMRILSSLDAAALANLPADMRFVFATSPTQMQRDLGPGAVRALDDFVREYGLWANAMSRYVRPVVDDAGFTHMGDPTYFGPLSERPAKILLTVYRWGSEGGLNFELAIADAKGVYIANASTTVHVDDSMPMPTEAPPVPENDPVVRFSHEAEVLLELMRGGTEPGALDRLAGDVREKLLNPERYDPLSLLAAEVVALAAGDKQLVAMLPDRMFSIHFPSGVRASQLRQVLNGYGVVRIEDEDEWMVVTPYRPVEARQRFTDRAALGEFLRAIAAQGGPSLESLSRYALRTPDAGSDSLGSLYLFMLFSDSITGFDVNNWDLLRFYGSLQQAQRQALLAGQTLRVSTLGQEQQRHLTRLIFYRTPLAGGSDLEATSAQAAIVYGTIFSEPTQVMPNGLPAEAVVGLNQMGDRVVIPATQGHSLMALSAEELGSHLAMKERPDLFPWVTELPDLSSFRMAQRDRFTFRIQLNQDLAQTFVLTDVAKQGAQSPVLGLNQLPPDFLAVVEKTRADIREAQKDMKPGDFGFSDRHRPPPVP